MKTSIFFTVLLISASTIYGQMDKYLHAGAGYVISSSSAAYLRSNNVKHAEWYGFGLGVLAGIGKEVYDYKSGRGQAEWGDAVATIYGSMFGAVTIRMAISGKPRTQVIIGQ